MKKVYMAGPDVFSDYADEIAQLQEQVLNNYDYTGLFPIDDQFDDPEKIYNSNIEKMKEADLCIANFSPFNGVHADPGTVFEIGWFKGQGKPVYGYTDNPFFVENREKSAGYEPSDTFEQAENLMVTYGLNDAFVPNKILKVRPHLYGLKQLLIKIQYNG